MGEQARRGDSLEALQKARPFVETLALRPSSYWIVEREKIIRECAAIAAKEAVNAYDVDSRDEAKLIADRIAALIETPTNPIEGAAMLKLAEEALAQIDAALAAAGHKQGSELAMNEPTFEELDSLGFDLWSRVRPSNTRDLWGALDEGERSYWRSVARLAWPLRARVVELETQMATALQHLEKGRALWNGPSHQCAYVLRDALGMGEQSAENTASPWREQAKFWEDQTAALRAQNADLVAVLAAAEPVHNNEGYLTLEASGMSIAAWVEKRDAALAAAGHMQGA